jgi:GTP 3',8-cyclase
MKDSHGRTIRDLRISITDRCNFRCSYCMPAEGVTWKPKSEILSYEEIVFLAGLFVELGVAKIRVTGGEALLRREAVALIRELARLPGLEDIALTTNGYYFKEHAAALAAAGLKRVTVSLDSLNPQGFAALTKMNALDRVLEAVAVAKTHGLSPVKVNAVMIRGARPRHALY